MARSVIAATLSVAFIGALSLATAPPSAAQDNATGASTAAVTATDPDPANATTGLTDAQLGDLVGRIALYPDDLLALILPASTVPLEIVQAQRFLKEAKGKKDPQPPESISEPVRNLLNYPDIIDQMNNDLDWVQALGQAVFDDQQGVMDAVQAFRMKAYSAGNLKTDDKQKVQVTEQTIVIEPAKPDVIYVPQYEPATVVVASSYPVYGYWPTAYPSYYYPYPPGYAFASGVFWGATAAWAFNWAGGGIGWGGGDIDIDIDRNVNRNSNRNTNRSTDRSGNRGDGNRGSGNRGGGANSGTWNPKGKGGGQAGTRPTTRPGDAGFKPSTTGRTGAGAGNRASAGTSNRAGAGSGAGNRASAGGGKGNFHAPSTRPASRPSGNSGTRPSTSPASRSSSNAGLRSSSSAASRSSGSSRGSHGSRGSSPRSSSYGGMSGRQASAAGSRGSMSRGGGGGSRGGRGGGGGRRR